MHTIKNILDLYIKSSTHVALAVTSLVGVWSIESDTTLSVFFYSLVFFATISGYNFVKYAKVAGLHHRSLTNALQAIQVFSFFCFLLFIISIFKVRVYTLLGGLALTGLTLFYAVPLLRNKSLRTLTGLKVIIVAIVWAGVTAILPALESETVLSKTIWITFFQRVLLVIVLMIPFEIRDLKFDKEALGTMPQKWGVKKTKFVGLVLLILVLTIENFKNVVSVSHISALLATCFILGVVIRMTRKKQSEYFAALWVESIPIIYFVLLKLLSHFLL